MQESTDRVVRHVLEELGLDVAADRLFHDCIAFSIPELIRTGTATVIEIGTRGHHVLELAGRDGLAPLPDGTRRAS